VTADLAERYAHQLDAIAERVEAMTCTRALHDVDHDEFYDGPCAHCDLLLILEMEPQV